MRLQPPDQLSTVLIWVSAIFMALKGGFDAWPAAQRSLPGMSANWLNFVPLLLLAVAALRSMTSPVRAGHAPLELSTPPQPQPPPQPQASESTGGRPVSITSSSGLTVKQLIKINSDHTAIQSKEYFDKFYGNEFSVTGKVANVIINNDSSVMVFIDLGQLDIVHCRFKKTSHRLIGLRKGDEISVTGNLCEVSGLGAALQDCEFI